MLPWKKGAVAIIAPVGCIALAVPRDADAARERYLGGSAERNVHKTRAVSVTVQELSTANAHPGGRVCRVFTGLKYRRRGDRLACKGCGHVASL